MRALGPGDPALPELGVDGVAERHRFAQGARCLAVFLRGRAVGCAWFTLGSFQEDEVRCRFVPHPPGLAAWDLGIHVLPAWRGGRAFAKLWDAVDLELRRAGVAWSMSRISVFNPASRRAHERAGAIEVGRLHGLRIGPLQMLIRERPWRISLTIRHVPTVPVPAPQQISNGGGWSDPNRRAR